MATFTEHVKSAAYTEVEVAALVAGAVASAKWITKERFNLDPDGFVSKNFDLIKAGGGALAATYVTNPWLKLLLMGIALQGTTAFARERFGLDHEGNPRIPILDTPKNINELDKKLKEAAANFSRTSESISMNISDTPQHSAVSMNISDTPEKGAVAYSYQGAEGGVAYHPDEY